MHANALAQHTWRRQLFEQGIVRAEHGINVALITAVQLERTR